MWNPAINQVPQNHLHHQQAPQHHFNNNNNGSSSLHSAPHQTQQAPPPQQQQQQQQQQHVSDPGLSRAKDLHSWCEAFDKHELVDILVKISKTNSQFQSYLGHAFVTDIKWCKIRVTFSPSPNSSASQLKQAPSSTQIQQHFMQYGNIKTIDCFPSHNSALITYENYTFAQSAVSVGVHDNVCNTGYNASCCYEFEGNEQPQNGGNIMGLQNGNNMISSQTGSSMMNNNNHNNNSSSIGPLEQRRIFVSSLSYSTSDETLENVFSQYGELEDCTIVKDKLTTRSKGYGFVVFKTVGGAVNALKQPEKFIDGRRTRSWLAAQGNQFRNQNR